MTHLDTSELELRAGWGMGGGERDGRRREQEMDIKAECTDGPDKTDGI